MFGTIRKHQSWLWFIIIGLMVIGMITWQNQLGKSGNGQQSAGSFGVIEGRAITQTEFRNAEGEATLQYLVRTHQWPDSGPHSDFDLNRETYERLFLVRKLEQYNIHIDSDTVAQFANVILRQFGNGQAIPLDSLLEQFQPHGISAEDFQRFLEHYLAIQQLASVVGVNGGLVTPQEVQSLYVHEYQEITADAVFFNASNYLAKIPDPSPESLMQFYTNQQAEYRQPDQLQLSYVFFNVTNFMPEAEQKIGITNLNREADEALTRLGTNGMRFGKTPEEARAKIRDMFIQETALSNAFTKAVSFQNELVAKNATNLNTLAREKGLEVKISQPFDKEYGPSDLHLGSSYPVAALFNLTPQQPFADEPTRGTDGVYILAYHNLTPSRIPPLNEIRSRVIADYKYGQAMRLAQMNGHIFAQNATNELAHGKTFSAIAAAGKVDPIEVPAFSLNSETLPKIEDLVEPMTFKEVAFGTAVGKISGFTPTREGGFVVYVRERLPVDEAKMKTQLPEFAKIVRQRRQSEAFELWFNREASTALRDLPAFQSPPRR
ncbi:MAG TPA: hypothetical protein VG938_03835 [Verrucomicrobiae bacterium]|jgi:hypothetical protein|nr:hypothetical protein [Verrucomicrobiae bacterium]